MVEHVLRDRLVLRRVLRDLELGTDPREETQVRKHPERDRRLLGVEHLGDLLLDPLTREALGQARALADRLRGAGIDKEPEACREADRAQHPQRILLEALGWLTH